MSEKGKIRVRIGAGSTGRELEVELEGGTDDFAAQISKSLEKGDKLLDLTAVTGERVLIPLDQLAYVEVLELKPKAIGFGA